MVQKEIIADKLQELQDHICEKLESYDGNGKFQEDAWERPGGGGGRTRIMNKGNLIEKGGVNFSAVHGETPEKIYRALGLEAGEFFATGVSIVLHPENPMVPIIHMNVRYFEMSNDTWWFGGGIDLTPHYVDKQQAIDFHQSLKKVCDQYDSEYYKKFSDWADKYFYIKHRKETRGIGGIFFDRLNDSGGKSKEELLNFILELGYSFFPVYQKASQEGRNKAYTEDQKLWQHLRRGRYVEFNLVYDRGTKFGLDTDGRIESILMSLPKTAGWEYDFPVKESSPEEQTLQYLRNKNQWI